MSGLASVLFGAAASGVVTALAIGVPAAFRGIRADGKRDEILDRLSRISEDHEARLRIVELARRRGG